MQQPLAKAVFACIITALALELCVLWQVGCQGWFEFSETGLHCAGRTTAECGRAIGVAVRAQISTSDFRERNRALPAVVMALALLAHPLAVPQETCARCCGPCLVGETPALHEAATLVGLQCIAQRTDGTSKDLCGQRHTQQNHS